MKKVLPLALAVLIIFSMFTSISASAALVGEDGFYYSLDTNNKTALLEEYSGTNETVDIPSYAFGYRVTGIKDGCFYKMRKIVAVNMPDTIEEIGEYVFQECKNLKEVVFSASMTKYLQEHSMVVLQLKK